MSSLFDYSSYKLYLKAHIGENANQRGYQARMAEAAGCQSSYLSQVLTAKAELTPDHAAGIATYIGLQGLEQEYLLTLVAHARAISPALKAITQTKLNNLKQSYRQLSERIASKKDLAPMPSDALYHSSWMWMAVHFLTSIPEFQQVKAIASHLRVRPEKVHSVLETLTRWGCVNYKAGRWSFGTNSFHVHRDSPMVEANHLNWRARAIAEVQNPKEESIHYSAVFTMLEEDFEKLRELTLESIERGRALIEPSTPKKMYCMTCDLFEVS